MTRSNLVRQPVLELFPADLVYHIAAGRRPALRHLSVASSLFQLIPAYSNVFFSRREMTGRGIKWNGPGTYVEQGGIMWLEGEENSGNSGIFRDIPGYSGISKKIASQTVIYEPTPITHAQTAQ